MYWQIYTNIGHPFCGRKKQADLPSSLVPNLKKGFGVTNPDLREGPESGGLCRHPLVFPYSYSRWCFHSLLAAVIPGWLILLCCCPGAWVGSGFSLWQVKCYSAEHACGSKLIGSGKGASPREAGKLEELWTLLVLRLQLCPLRG